MDLPPEAPLHIVKTVNEGRSTVAKLPLLPGEEALRSPAIMFALEPQERVRRCGRCACVVKDGALLEGTLQCQLCGQFECDMCAKLGEHDKGGMCSLLARLAAEDSTVVSSTVALLGALLLRGAAECAVLCARLVGHEDKLDEDTIRRFRSIATGVARAVQRITTTDEAPLHDRAPACEHGGGVEALAGVAFSLLCRIACNSHAVVAHEGSLEQGRGKLGGRRLCSGTTSFIGQFVCCHISISNHSCRPTASLAVDLVRGERPVGVIRVLEPIPSGGPVDVSYIPASGQELGSRRKALQEKYYFQCACRACFAEDKRASADKMVAAASCDREHQCPECLTPSACTENSTSAGSAHQDSACVKITCANCGARHDALDWAAEQNVLEELTADAWAALTNMGICDEDRLDSATQLLSFCERPLRWFEPSNRAAVQCRLAIFEVFRWRLSLQGVPGDDKDGGPEEENDETADCLEVLLKVWEDASTDVTNNRPLPFDAITAGRIYLAAGEVLGAGRRTTLPASSSLEKSTRTEAERQLRNSVQLFQRAEDIFTMLLGRAHPLAALARDCRARSGFLDRALPNDAQDEVDEVEVVELSSVSGSGHRGGIEAAGKTVLKKQKTGLI